MEDEEPLEKMLCITYEKLSQRQDLPKRIILRRLLKTGNELLIQRREEDFNRRVLYMVRQYSII